VSGPQGLIFSQDRQPPPAPQIVEQRRPDSSVSHLSTLIIASFDPAANDDSLLLDDHIKESAAFSLSLLISGVGEQWNSERT